MSGAIALALWPPQRDDFSRLPAFSREEQRQQELAAQVRAEQNPDDRCREARARLSVGPLGDVALEPERFSSVTDPGRASGFDYGIGRDAFLDLDDASVTDP